MPGPEVRVQVLVRVPLWAWEALSALVAWDWAWEAPAIAKLAWAELG